MMIAKPKMINAIPLFTRWRKNDAEEMINPFVINLRSVSHHWSMRLNLILIVYLKSILLIHQIACWNTTCNAAYLLL